MLELRRELCLRSGRRLLVQDTALPADAGRGRDLSVPGLLGKSQGRGVSEIG
jgi:hypothetical protein